MNSTEFKTVDASELPYTTREALAHARRESRATGILYLKVAGRTLLLTWGLVTDTGR